MDSDAGWKNAFDRLQKRHAGVSETLFLPLPLTHPPHKQAQKAEGKITLTALSAPTSTKTLLPFRVFRPVAAERERSPSSIRSAKLRPCCARWATPCALDGGAPSGRVVIGRKVLSNRQLVPGALDAFVRNGGRLLVAAQEPAVDEIRLQLRVAPQVTRRVYPVRAGHPILAGVDAEDLRDWNGSSRLTEAYPHYPGFEWAYTYGWKWGNRGGVSSAPVEKPHRTSWRPILETEFDLAYTPLMEMDYGKGRIVLSTLDLEDHALVDPAARKLARQLVDYVVSAPLSPKATIVNYIGDDAGATLLNSLGVKYSRAQALTPATALAIVGTGANITDAALRRYIQKRRQNPCPGFERRNRCIGRHAGKEPVVRWFAAGAVVARSRRLSASDLRSRAETETWLLKGGTGWEVSADGLLGRLKWAKVSRLQRKSTRIAGRRSEALPALHAAGATLRALSQAAFQHGCNLPARRTHDGASPAS
jgi:beta-galactosidase